MIKKRQYKSAPLRVLSTCLWLVDILQSHKRITYETLNDLWVEHNPYLNKAGNYDLEKRTLRDYWKYIDEMFNIVVRCDRHTNEYYIEEHYDSKITDWLLSTFSLSKVLGESREIHDRILLEDIPSGRNFLSSILSAIKENHPVTITYQKFFEDEPYTVTGDPLCLKLVQLRWYAMVRVKGRDHYGIYALDRIQALNVESDRKFELSVGFDPASYFEFSYGAFATDEKKCCLVKIWTDDFQRKYWLTLPVHHSQQMIESCPDHSVFTFLLQITPDFENYLLSLGSHIRVLYPKSLAESIRKQHLSAAEQYDSAVGHN